ncbi:MAG TPA: TldD/PmbA family protein [Anaerolineae bacterium]|nr:TldD/PmbA family protein [Anaerolineae bacterium]HQI84574.1 TldD/PmbA family protein [Anaerolineae bacterium]
MDVLAQLIPQTEQVEVVRLSNETTTVNFESNQLKTSKVEETAGIAVRVIKDGRLGFAASSDLTATDKLVRNTLESAAYGDPVPLVFPGSQPGSDVRTFDTTIADLPVTRMVEIGQEVIAYLRDIDPDVLLNVTLKRGINQVTIRNQAGADVAFRRSPFSLQVEVNRVKGDDILIMFDMLGVTIWDADYMLPVRRLGDKLRQAQQIGTLAPGRMPVLFSPTGTLVLGLPLMEGVDGKNVYKGISPMAGKVGEKLFDAKLTLVDDGTLDGKFGSAAYDDEGVPHRRTVLIGNGVLNGFLYDLKTAAQSGVESTGNGSRGLFNQPSPAPTNLIIAPGETPLAHMLAGIDEGLLVQDVLGLGQGNVLSGAFSNPIALGFKIEKGEIVGRVKDVAIAGNVYEVLQNIAAVSRENDWIYSNFNAPYILLEEMNVAGKA